MAPMAAPARASNCTCFRFCNETDVRSFHLRLPRVTSRPSPWHAYLSTVYGKGAAHKALPIDLTSFEFFYLRLLPVEWRCRSQWRHICSPEACSGWLRPNEPSAAQLKEHAQSWDVMPYHWHRSRLPRLMFNHTLRFLPRRPSEVAYRTATQLEVIRRAFDGWNRGCAVGKGRDPNDWVGDRSNGAGEGVRYGCWFSPCVGTGIFLPLGRSLVLRDRVHVEQVLPEVLRFPRVPTPVVAPELGRVIEVTGGSNASMFRHQDCMYATLARARGFDSLVMPFGAWGTSEVVATAPGCMERSTPLPTGCVPPDVGLRTGWRGEQPCKCTEVPVEGLDRILNCAGSNGMGQLISSTAEHCH